jgi:hypothetical protein
LATDIIGAPSSFDAPSARQVPDALREGEEVPASGFADEVHAYHAVVGHGVRRATVRFIWIGPFDRPCARISAAGVKGLAKYESRVA